MFTILSLFGRSPFLPLLAHMEKVATCVALLPSLFSALKKKDAKLLMEIATNIANIEHHADLAKNDIRNHLSKNMFLAIDRSQLLEILAIQDNIADMAEDIAVLTTLKELDVLPAFEEEFFLFLNKNMETFQAVFLIIKEINELLETSFGGNEAEKVRDMIEEVSFKEHQADELQINLLKKFFNQEELPQSSFSLWQKIFESVAAISNLSEKLAHRIRMTLELK